MTSSKRSRDPSNNSITLNTGPAMLHNTRNKTAKAGNHFLRTANKGHV